MKILQDKNPYQDSSFFEQAVHNVEQVFNKKWATRLWIGTSIIVASYGQPFMATCEGIRHGFEFALNKNVSNMAGTEKTTPLSTKEKMALFGASMILMTVGGMAIRDGVERLEHGLFFDRLNKKRKWQEKKQGFIFADPGP